MNKFTAQAIVKALSIEFPESSHTVYEGYSGRGMYGKITTGVATDMKPQEVIQAIINNPEEFLDLEERASNFRTDNLGMGYIIY